MTGYAERLAAVRRDLERGDVAAATERVGDLSRSEPSVTDLLGEFRTAVEDGDYELAESVLVKLQQRYGDVRSEENVLIAKALSVRANGEVDVEDRESAQQFLQEASTVDLQRSGFLVGAATLIARPEEADHEQVTSSASSLQDKETTKAQAASDAEGATANATIPPSIAMNALQQPQGTFLVGTSYGLDVAVTNAGDEAAENVVVRFDVPDGLSLDSSLLRVGSLAGGATATEQVTVTGESAGSYTLGAEATADGADPTVQEVIVEVAEPSSDLTVVEEIVGVDGEAQFDDVITAISLYNQGKPVPETEKRVGFQDVLEIIAAYNEGPADE